MKSRTALIFLSLLLFLCVAGLLIYFHHQKTEDERILNNIHVGDIPNADEVKNVIKDNTEKRIEEAAELRKVDQPNPPKPVTDLSEIENSGMIEIDSKLYISEEAELDPKVIQIIYDLKDLKLCGEVYKSKQLIIGGVDIIQRLSEILLEDKQISDWFCGIVLSRADDTSGVIKPGEEIMLSLRNDNEYYSFTLSLGVGLADLYNSLPYTLNTGFGGTTDTKQNIISIGYIHYPLRK